MIAYTLYRPSCLNVKKGDVTNISAAMMLNRRTDITIYLGYLFSYNLNYTGYFTTNSAKLPPENQELSVKIDSREH